MGSFQCDDVDWQKTRNTFVERNRHMFNNSDMSDISLACKGSHKTFYAHKYLLGTSSAVFHAMFSGDLAEKGPIVYLADTTDEGLEQFLRFLYTEECTLTADNIFDIMYLADKYIIPSLRKKCIKFLFENLTVENVLDVLDQATRFEAKELENQCLKIIQSNTTKVVACDSFNNISQNTLATLLKQDTLKIPEVKLFQAVLKWIDFQCSRKDLEPTRKNRRSIIGEAIYDFRFAHMSQAEFLENVTESGLLDPEELVPIYENYLGRREAPASKWTLPNRKTENIVRFCRFPGKTKKLQTLWEYGSAADRIRFCANEEVSLLGVRLFGEQGSEYLVEFTVNEAKVVGTYSSELNDDDIPGFDVMLQKPVILKENIFVTLSAKINGPDSCSGKNGLSSITHDGVTVTFKHAPCATNKTCTDQGQFHEIILAI